MIHDAVLGAVKTALEHELRDRIDPFNDPARVSIVQLGPLQGDPDPDEARIFITLHENDPDNFISGAITGMKGEWEDEIYDIEIGGVTTWKRRFTVKGRCLLESSGEDLANARQVASTVRSRIERCLMNMSFGGITSEDGEMVTRGVVSDELRGEMMQAGGPPDSYDYFIKVRFSVLTTTPPRGQGE